MIRYIIIDDEPLAHELLVKYCTNFPFLKLEKQCYDAIDAIQFLSGNNVDLIFLDINMPKLTGFNFLRTLSNVPKVIVTTAYEEFALEGYELKVSDYLLKPFSFERFAQAINTTFENHSITATISTEPKNDHFIFIKGDKKYHQINLNEILYIEAYGNYTKLHFKDQMILSHVNISSFEKDLADKNFIRVHKSFLVSKPKIEEIEGNRIKILEHKIPVGQKYKSTVTGLIDS